MEMERLNLKQERLNQDKRLREAELALKAREIDLGRA